MLTLIKLNQSPGAWVAWLSCQCWPWQVPLWLSLQVHWLSAASPIHPAASAFLNLADVSRFSGVWLESQGSIQNCYYFHKLYENKVQMAKCQQAQHLPCLLLWTSWEGHSYLHRPPPRHLTQFRAIYNGSICTIMLTTIPRTMFAVGFEAEESVLFFWIIKIIQIISALVLFPPPQVHHRYYVDFLSLFTLSPFFALLIVLFFIWSDSELLQILSSKRCAV